MSVREARFELAQYARGLAGRWVGGEGKDRASGVRKAAASDHERRLKTVAEGSDTLQERSG